MSRNRLIKKEFFRDEKIAALSLGARLLFISLWIQADDVGNGRADPRLLKAEGFGYDSVSAKRVEKWFQELVKAGLVKPYEVGKVRFFSVVHFLEHQTIDRPSKFRYAPPPWPDDGSTSTRRALDDEGKGKGQSQSKGEGERESKGEGATTNNGDDETDRVLSSSLDLPVTDDRDRMTCSKQTTDYFGFCGVNRKLLGKVSVDFSREIQLAFMSYRQNHHRTGEKCSCSPVEFLELLLEQCEEKGIRYPKGILAVKKSLEKAAT